MITHSTRFQILLGLRFTASDLVLSHPMTVVLRNILIPFPFSYKEHASQPLHPDHPFLNLSFILL